MASSESLPDKKPPVNLEFTKSALATQSRHRFRAVNFEGVEFDHIFRLVLRNDVTDSIVIGLLFASAFLSPFLCSPRK